MYEGELQLYVQRLVAQSQIRKERQKMKMIVMMIMMGL